jgi:hypothetical protein
MTNSSPLRRGFCWLWLRLVLRYISLHFTWRILEHERSRWAKERRRKKVKGQILWHKCPVMHSKNFLVYVTPFYLATIIPTDHVITSTILLDCYLTLWTFLEHHQIDEQILNTVWFIMDSFYQCCNESSHWLGTRVAIICDPSTKMTRVKRPKWLDSSQQLQMTHTRLVDFCHKWLESTQLQFVQDKFIKNIVVE